MAGIEMRGRIAAIARAALEDEAEIIEGDARTVSIERASAVLMFDVLHLMRPEEQEALLSETAARLEPGGVVLVREADASAGWRFTAVRLGNRLKAIAFGTRHQSFHARTARGMARLFRATRLQGRGTADGSRDAVRQRAVPPHRGAGRVCACSPIVTSCVRARPSGPKTPPNHSAHARSPARSGARQQ